MKQLWSILFLTTLVLHADNRFAGTWEAKFNEEPLCVVQLQNGRAIKGTIRFPVSMQVDPSGRMTGFQGPICGAVPISVARVEGSKIYFEAPDGDDTIQVELDISTKGRGSLRFLDIKMKPIPISRTK